MIQSMRAEHSSIVRGMGWLILYIVVGRIVAAVREIAIAARYGTGEIVDAYLFVFNLVTWPAAVWFGILSVVMIPAAARLRQDRPGTLPHLQGAMQSASAGLGAALAIAMAIVLWFVLAPSARLLPASTASLAREMIIYLAPLLLVGCLSSLYSVWLMTVGSHANTLIEAVPPFVLLVVVLSASVADAEALLWGTVVGFVLQLAVLLGYLGSLGGLARPRLSGPSPQWRLLWWSIGVMAIGQVLSTASNIIDQFMVAPLGTGAIATLGYASRILALLTGLTALVVSRATLPVFSASAAAKDRSLYRLCLSWSGLLFLLGLAGAAIAYLLAPWGVALLFQRGAFSAEDTVAVSQVFSFGLAQLPFYCGGLVLVSALAATGRYWLLTGIGALNLIVKVGANWMLIPVFGIAGVTLATGVMYAISTAIMLVVVVRPMRRASPHPVGREV